MPLVGIISNVITTFAASGAVKPDARGMSLHDSQDPEDIRVGAYELSP